MQLTLGTPRKPHVTGTVVMSNLGYFQLQVRVSATGRVRVYRGIRGVEG